MKVLITIADGETGEVIREIEWDAVRMNTAADAAQEIVDMIERTQYGPLKERST